MTKGDLQVHLEDKVCGLVVTHEPGPDLIENLAAICPQVRTTLLVDNGSRTEFSRGIIAQAAKLQSVVLISNETNEGIGSALNAGFLTAQGAGFKYVLALDQDSCPDRGLLKALADALTAQAAPDAIAIVSPHLSFVGLDVQARYLRRRWGPLFEMVGCTAGFLTGVTTTITSGSLFSLAAYREVGPFREDFFMDYVDTEYCLRARMKGFDIVVACHGKVAHHWGNRSEVEIGPVRVRPTNHSPSRWYYISRNRIPVLAAFGVANPHWLVFDLLAAAWWFVRMLVFERDRLKKTRAVLLGTRDGFLGRMGEQSAVWRI